MNNFKNIRKIGYVDSNFTNVAPATYTKNIQTYAGWNTANCTSDIHLDGIFIDDMSNTNTTTVKNYYKSISSVVNSTMPSGKNFLMLNAGAATDASFFNYATAIITFENYYSQTDAPGSIFNTTGYSNAPRQKQAYIAHDYTGNAATQQQLSDRMGETEAMGYFFLTDKTQATNPYGDFPSLWAQEVGSVNATDLWMAQHPQWYSS